MNSKERFKRLKRFGFKLLDRIYGDLEMSDSKSSLYDKVFLNSDGYVVLGVEGDFVGFYKNEKREYDSFLFDEINFNQIIVLWINEKYKLNLKNSGDTPMFLNRENSARSEQVNESNNPSLIKLSRRLDQLNNIFFYSLTTFEPEYFENYSEFESEVINGTIHNLFNENYEDIELYNNDYESSVYPLKIYLLKKFRNKIKKYWEEYS
jgi:hypothetical protein